MGKKTITISKRKRKAYLIEKCKAMVMKRKQLPRAEQSKAVESSLDLNDKETLSVGSLEGKQENSSNYVELQHMPPIVAMRRQKVLGEIQTEHTTFKEISQPVAQNTAIADAEIETIPIKFEREEIEIEYNNVNDDGNRQIISPGQLLCNETIDTVDTTGTDHTGAGDTDEDVANGINWQHARQSAGSGARDRCPAPPPVAPRPRPASTPRSHTHHVFKMEDTEQGVIFKKKRITRCDVPGCYNSSTKNPELKFFQLPNDLERRQLWLRQLKYKAAPGSPLRLLICDKHFHAKYVQHNHKRSRLLKAAVPTLFLPTTEEPGSPPSISPVVVKVEQLDPDATPTTSQTHDAPIKHQLNAVPEFQRPIKRVKIKEEPHCLTVFYEEEGDEEHGEVAVANELEYVPQLEQQLQIKEEPTKKIYSLEFKMFALELYFKSPNAYRLLQKSFKLPRISTLYKLCIPANTVISQSVLKALSIQANSMTAEQKQCVVCVGTMSIAPNIHYNSKHHKIFGFHDVDGVQSLEPARKFLVVMVRGLFHKWKQAVAFAFLADLRYNGVSDFIDDIILKMFEVGLIVRVLMTDLDIERFSSTKDSDLNSKEPFFLLNDRKIYYMNDPLLLMTNIRDNFVHNNYVFYSGLVAKWQHVVECYTHDYKKNMLRLAPKLSTALIMYNDEMNNLNLTVDLFSKSTAAAIIAYIELNVLPSNAKDTVQWIVTMNKLMEMLNFSSIQAPEDKRDVFSGGAAQVDFLVEMLSFFNNMRIISTNRKDIPTYSSGSRPMHLINANTSFVEGFKVTINAILLLYGDLKKEKCWFPVVGLSQDCLCEFFDKILRKHNVGRPTAQHVLQCINQFPIFNIFKYYFKKRSPNDLEYFMSHARSMPDIKKYELARATTEQYVEMSAEESAAFYAIELQKDKKKHLALYLLYKGYKEHSDCSVMSAYTCADNFIEDFDGGMPFISHKIHTPPREFLEFIEEMEINFQDYFEKNVLTMSFADLLSDMKNVIFETPCDCFPLQYIKQLFSRFRFYTLLRYNNKMFRSKGPEKTFVVDNL